MRIPSSLLLLAWACLARATALAAEPLVVLTNYHDDVTLRHKAAFERLHPDVDVQFVHRSGAAATRHLLEDAPGTIDVYWAAGHRGFAALRDADALTPLTGLDADAALLPLSDPAGRFLATEVALYGIAYHPGAFARAGLDVPRDWSDLVDRRLTGRVLLPVPSRVGFAGVLVDGILQTRGWQEGWALLLRIAARARLAEKGSTYLVDEILAGRADAGLCIDFVARIAIDRDSALAFHQPATGGLSVAYAAVPAGAPHPDAARRFIAFLRSPAGQRLLLAPDIGRLPVRTDVFLATAKHPLADSDAPALRYDRELGARRAGLVSALFDVAITQRHADLVDAWLRLDAARARTDGDATARAQVLDEAEHLLSTVPLTASESADPALAARFDGPYRGAATAAAVLAAWRDDMDQRTRAALRLLETLP